MFPGELQVTAPLLTNTAPLAGRTGSPLPCNPERLLPLPEAQVSAHHLGEPRVQFGSPVAPVGILQETVARPIGRLSILKSSFRDEEELQHWRQVRAGRGAEQAGLAQLTSPGLPGDAGVLHQT